MKNKILVAVDGSETGNRAIACAAKAASQSGDGVVLAYVIEWSPYSFHTPEELAERHKRRESEISRAEQSVLTPQAEKLRAANINVEAVVRHGHIGETLSDIADEYGVSQVYIGRRGESKIQTILFGSVTAALIQTSSVPVTVVP
ncbi:MAG: universal stress protein [Gammaproteobacteria bacterium]|nr:universal stress protein [Gammaproteobacteria bacterium]